MKPILFSTEMVRAILAGNKMQTRRVIKPQPEDGLHNDTAFPRALESTLKGWNGVTADTGESREFKCPYGSIGDVLWVRETWRKYCRVDENGYTHFDETIIEYAADGPDPIYLVDGDGAHMYNKDGSEKYVPWRPSIFMPKEACRLFLKITDIRVERLQSISEADAKAEGVRPFVYDGCGVYENYLLGRDTWCMSAAGSFATLWQSINGPDSWQANPYVWAISFERIEKPIKF